MSEQLAKLAARFPERFVHGNPSGGGTYVSHDVVTQRLLFVVGPFDFRLVEVLRGDVAAIEPNPQGSSNRAKQGAPALTQVVVGAICRLSCFVDGIAVSVEEVGDCEAPHNWPHDGARMKDAMSDAIKRCAMRLGCGLHLWAQEEYVLDVWLAKRAESEAPLDNAGEAPVGVAGPTRTGGSAVRTAGASDVGESTPADGAPAPVPLGADA